VVTTLGRMDQHAKNYLVALLHFPRTYKERDDFVRRIESQMDDWHPNLTSHARKQIQEMPQFYFCGVAVGKAYAHPQVTRVFCFFNFFYCFRVFFHCPLNTSLAAER
jgi:hypothetical protein